MLTAVIYKLRHNWLYNINPYSHPLPTNLYCNSNLLNTAQSTLTTHLETNVNVGD